MMVSAVDETGESILNNEFWSDNLSLLNLGKCHTLNSTKFDIGFDTLDSLQVTYNRSVDQFTIIHDPNFFILGPNPETMPRIMITQDDTYRSQTY